MANLICPKCGEKVDESMTPYWVWQQRFYCSEKCVRAIVTPKI